MTLRVEIAASCFALGARQTAGETALRTRDDRSRFRRHIENRLADAVLRVSDDDRSELMLLACGWEPSCPMSGS